jgi:hypothetical protein
MQRFWSKVDIKGADDCWPWLAGRNNCGYGEFGVRNNGKFSKWKAHRFAWTLWHSEDPGRLEVCHKCDNPSCVNPSHLFLGTHKDNIRDMHQKKRSWQAKRSECPLGHQYSGTNLVINKRGHRVCRECSLEDKRRRRKLFRLLNPKRNFQKEKTHCPKGHPYAGANLKIKRGQRVCLTCSRKQDANRQRRKRMKEKELKQ